jgi:hypothetical protein
MIVRFQPDVSKQQATAVCFTLYDWQHEVTEKWIDATEAIFDYFGIPPMEGTSQLDVRHTHGRFSRVKGKIREFVSQSSDFKEFDVRVRGAVTHADDAFFPSDMEVVFSENRNSVRSLCVSARHNIVSSPIELFNKLVNEFIQISGSCYGAVFDFPTKYGPEAYLSSVSVITKGSKWGENSLYVDRMNRWRDRSKLEIYNPKKGYFRELYEINIITDKHLNMPFKGHTLRQFADYNGLLETIPCLDGMYLWRIPSLLLEDVRGALEDSGLILSSPKSPLTFN